MAYLNVAVRSVPAWIATLGIDVVVYHTTLLARRWSPREFNKIRRKLRRLLDLGATKVAIPQDEFLHTDLLGEFLRDFKVDHVLTCAPPSEWPVIYGDLTKTSMTFTQVLTGYLDSSTLARIERLAGEVGPRSVDIAYRAWRPEFWLGRHGQLKGAIADTFEAEAPLHGLATDISTRAQDTLLGDDWFRLLLRSRWTIGVEGGASIIDRNGSLRLRTLEYREKHPEASFEEVEAACFPGQEGSLNLMALSPRHLEACVTRTAQVLVEGEYNGVLVPELHYLPLKRDFSNIAAVCESMLDEGLREALVARAYQDVVDSHRFDYGAFAEVVLNAVDGPRHARVGGLAWILWTWESKLDRASWWWVAIRQRIRSWVRGILALTGLLPRVQRLRGGVSVMREP